MRPTLIPAALAAIIAAAAAAPAAALTPPTASPATAAASAATPVQYYYGPGDRDYYGPRYHRRGGWVPHPLRGFEDPGYAYHGNVNGCAEDLGYGRWEPCDRGR
ncbi:MAG: hypothetical protein JO328_12480 [Hyphomicrobiales bacterium]|nr:hypothetical protein [Hyphomicrobiales bacterium]MBV8825811.1 hypothetical protein [Hyphomicrobiales bacterium]MBV9428257.1 hypothetical protein [Bradyrhizobiaceae bacterium]